MFNHYFGKEIVDERKYIYIYTCWSYNRKVSQFKKSKGKIPGNVFSNAWASTLAIFNVRKSKNKEKISIFFFIISIFRLETYYLKHFSRHLLQNLHFLYLIHSVTHTLSPYLHTYVLHLQDSIHTSYVLAFILTRFHASYKLTFIFYTNVDIYIQHILIYTMCIVSYYLKNESISDWCCAFHNKILTKS